MKDLVLLSPERQTVWRWPATLNFTLGGTGAGWQLATTLVVLCAPDSSRQSGPLLVDVLPAGMVLAGFLALPFEAGRPLRSHHLLRGLNHSWMSLEFLAGSVLIATVLFDVINPWVVLQGMAAISAGIFVISQGFIVYLARGVRHWNMWPVPLVFILTSIIAGAGMLLMTRTVVDFAFPPEILVFFVFLLLLNLVAWNVYVSKSSVSGYDCVAARLNDAKLAFVVVGFGHLAPMLVLLIVFGANVQDPLATVACGLGGLLMAIGAVVQKGVILQSAGYLRGLAFGRHSGDLSEARDGSSKGGLS